MKRKTKSEDNSEWIRDNAFEIVQRRIDRYDSLYCDGGSDKRYTIRKDPLDKQIKRMIAHYLKLATFSGKYRKEVFGPFLQECREGVTKEKPNKVLMYHKGYVSTFTFREDNSYCFGSADNDEKKVLGNDSLFQDMLKTMTEQEIENIPIFSVGNKFHRLEHRQSQLSSRCWLVSRLIDMLATNYIEKNVPKTGYEMNVQLKIGDQTFSAAMTWQHANYWKVEKLQSTLDTIFVTVEV